MFTGIFKLFSSRLNISISSLQYYKFLTLHSLIKILSTFQEGHFKSEYL